MGANHSHTEYSSLTLANSDSPAAVRRASSTTSSRSLLRPVTRCTSHGGGGERTLKANNKLFSNFRLLPRKAILHILLQIDDVKTLLAALSSCKLVRSIGQEHENLIWSHMATVYHLRYLSLDWAEKNPEASESEGSDLANIVTHTWRELVVRHFTDPLPPPHRVVEIASCLNAARIKSGTLDQMFLDAEKTVRDGIPYLTTKHLVYFVGLSVSVGQHVDPLARLPPNAHASSIANFSERVEAVHLKWRWRPRADIQHQYVASVLSLFPSVYVRFTVKEPIKEKKRFKVRELRLSGEGMWVVDETEAIVFQALIQEMMSFRFCQDLLQIKATVSGVEYTFEAKTDEAAAIVQLITAFVTFMSETQTV